MLSHLAKSQFAQPLTIDSCGMGDWHVGERPDPRMLAASMQRGVSLPGRARLLHTDDFDKFDLILAVDKQVLYDLYQKASTPQHKAKIHLVTAFSAAYHNMDVPDPYYSDEAAFNLVLDILEDSCEGILDHLKKET